MSFDLNLMHDLKYPLTSKYNPQWIYDHKMGCHVLWLTESLCQKLDLRPGMKVLDLGCGNALSSIFLAKEYQVQVFALDLWVDASENYKRVVEAGVENLVFPMKGEAHSLPFANQFFDAIISINAYQFFGTQDTYFADHLSNLLKSHGKFGLMVWGPDEEIDEVPEDMQSMWWPDFYYFHSLPWWTRQLNRTRLFEEIFGDDMDGDGVRVTKKWAQIMKREDAFHNNGKMRWNRIVCVRNNKSPDDFRIWD